MSLLKIAQFTEDQAREWLEAQRWPDGPVCPHCKSKEVTKLKGRSVRPGFHQCRKCRKQFTITTKTPLHGAKVPLNIWVYALHEWAASKNNISSVELARKIGVTQTTAWYMLKRIHLMASKEVTEKMKGTVEADEVYTGDVLKHEKTGKRGRGTAKATVFVMAQRSPKTKNSPHTPKTKNTGTGRVVAKPISKASGAIIRGQLLTYVDRKAAIHTDEYKGYLGVGKLFAGGHHTVRHNYKDKEGRRRREFVSKTGAHNNTAESFNARLRRGIRGSYHHVSKKHLARYCDEMVFRWNTRMLSDEERVKALLKGIQGKRLTYKSLTAKKRLE